MTQNPTCVKITRSIFMNKKLLVFVSIRQTAKSNELKVCK